MATTETAPAGLVLLPKPPGITSFAALGALKRALGTRKLGHTGTLDSFASGLLVVLVGKATKLVGHLTAMDKTYRATIRFGSETDTLDPTGEVVRTAPIPTLEVVKSVLPQFIGKIMQVPPVYSAIHVGGHRASDLVRGGEIPVMAAREVEIFYTEITEVRITEYTEVILEVRCSKGTYIRSLARDIGNACGSAAYLTGLERTAVGDFKLEEAKGELWPLTPPLAQRCGLKTIKLKDDNEVNDFLHGRPLSVPSVFCEAGSLQTSVREFAFANSVSLFSPSNEFLGIHHLS
jgi:tRNA pseudouridine55 synthase